MKCNKCGKPCELNYKVWICRHCGHIQPERPR